MCSRCAVTRTTRRYGGGAGGPSHSGLTDSGAAAVEFAIVAPVFILLIIGMLEFALVMRDNLSVAASVKVGARIASTKAGAGDGSCPSPLPEPSYVCAPANKSPALAVAAVNSVQQAGSVMPQNYVDYVWVYQSNASGWPGTASSAATATPLCNALDNKCVKFTWNKVAGQFQYASGSWDSSTIDACLMVVNPTTHLKTLNPNAASVGVYMHATHPLITRLFGVTVPIESRTVLKFDPLEARSCNGNGVGHGGHQ
jgi:hypothetical protein